MYSIIAWSPTSWTSVDRQRKFRRPMPVVNKLQIFRPIHVSMLPKPCYISNVAGGEDL